MESIDDFYKREQDDFHSYLQRATGSTVARVSSLYEEVLAYVRIDKEFFKEIKPNDKDTVGNRLRYLALRLDITAQRFQMLSMQEQHRFCAHLKELLAKNNVSSQYEEIVKLARKELMTLVNKEPECTDESILQWIQQYVDNEIRIVQFTDKWEEKFKSWLLWKAKSKTNTFEAEDLVEQTYLHTLKSIRRHHELPEEGKIKAWLVKIMQNALNDNVRDINRHNIHIEPLDEQTEQLLDEEDIETTVIDEQGKKALEEILQTLQPDDRQVMTLYLLQDLPLSEIAVVLNEELEAVRARFKRARPKLLAKLPAKSLAEYLKRSPKAQFKLQNLLRDYIPTTKAAKSFRMADINVESPLQYEIIVRSMLSSHIVGYDSREIAEMFTYEKTDAAAFAKRVAAIQTCLEENLLRLFTSYYKKNGNQE